MSLLRTSDKCSYNCTHQTSDGYCKFTACINPKFNGSGTYIIKDKYIIKDDKKEDPDYGIGRWS